MVCFLSLKVCQKTLENHFLRLLCNFHIRLDLMVLKKKLSESWNSMILCFSSTKRREARREWWRDLAYLFSLVWISALVSGDASSFLKWYFCLSILTPSLDTHFLIQNKHVHMNMFKSEAARRVPITGGWLTNANRFLYILILLFKNLMTFKLYLIIPLF